MSNYYRLLSLLLLSLIGGTMENYLMYVCILEMKLLSDLKFVYILKSRTCKTRETSASLRKESMRF